MQSDVRRLDEFLGHKLTKSLTLVHINDFMNTYYGEKSKAVFNKKLGRLRKIFDYLADESAVTQNFIKNKKPKRLNQEDARKKRMDLSLEAFRAIEAAAPLFLKVAMRLSLQSTHAVKELYRIKYRIRAPKPNTCGIVWLKEPTQKDGVTIYGTLYIHRAKAQKAKTSYVAIPVTQEIKDVVDLSRTDKLHCPYIVHRAPARRGKIAKDCDHRYQVQSKNISHEFAKVRDNLGLFNDVDKELRPTFHEIRRLSARLIDEMGINPRQRMAHASEQSTRIYTDKHDVEWHEVPAVGVRY